MQGESTWYSVNLRGIDESLEPLIAADPGSALNIEHMEFDSAGFWKKMPGTLQFGTWTAAGGTVFGLHWFNPRPGQRWLMYERVTDNETSELGYLALPAGTPTAIATRRLLAGVGFRSMLVEHDRWIYHINGYEAPLRWNGWRTAPMGFQAGAPAPIVAGEDASGGTAFYDTAGIDYATAVTSSMPQRGLGEFPPSAGTVRWVYGYCTTEINDLGMEGPPSEMVYVSGTNNATGGNPNGRSGAHLHINAGGDHIRGHNLYRTVNLIDVAQVNGREDVYLLRRFNFGGRFEWTDIAPDSELRELLDRTQLGPMPAGITAMCFHQGAAFVAVGDVVQWSHPELYEQMPVRNRAVVGSGATGRIVSMVSIADGIVIVKVGGTYMLKGNAVDGYHVETLSETVGTPSPRAVKQIHGFGVLLLAEAGPHVVVGRLEADEPSRLVPLTSQVKKRWRNLIGKSVLATAWGLHNPDAREVWFNCPQGGDSRPRMGIVFHYDQGRWSFRPGWDFACATFYGGRVWVGSHNLTSNATAGVHVLTQASTTRLGGSFSALYETGHMRLDAERTTPIRVNLRVYGGVGKVTALDHRADRRPTYTRELETRQPIQRHPEDSVDLWGVGKWDTSKVWVDDEFVMLPISLGETRASGLEHSFRLQGSLRLAALEVEARQPVRPPVRENRS